MPRLGKWAKALQRRLKDNRMRREVILHVPRGKDLHVAYTGRISTAKLFVEFAREKRVGKAHLVLKIDMD
eukprot:2157889-Amphidinium_carterae.1